MKTELQSYLKNKFPNIYDKDFQFECEDGWFRLILWLNKYIEDYSVQQNKYAEQYPEKYLPVKQVVVSQLKEKFGTLKFSYEGGNERLGAIISFVEYISGFMCEYTGTTEDVGFNKNGWIKTMHKSFAKQGDFVFVDDKILRQILSNQLEFNF